MKCFKKLSEEAGDTALFFHATKNFTGHNKQNRKKLYFLKQQSVFNNTCFMLLCSHTITHLHLQSINLRKFDSNILASLGVFFIFIQNQTMFHSQRTKLHYVISKNSVTSFRTRIHNVNEHSWVELYKLFELQGYSASPIIKNNKPVLFQQVYCFFDVH